jgi:K+-transporting ATPase A subunit
VVLVAVFIGGLMVGRTPEYLRKRIGYAEMRWVVVYALIPPTVILACTGFALATGAAVILALLNFLPALSLGTIADGLQ